MTHESNHSNTPKAPESLALLNSRANLRDAQDDIVTDYSPDSVKSWGGNLYSRLVGHSTSSETIDGVPHGSRQRYEANLLDYVDNKIPDDAKQDNHTVVSTLRSAHKELEHKLFSDSLNDREKRKRLTYGDAIAALGGAAVVSINTVTENGAAEPLLAAVAAGVAYESVVYQPTRRQIDDVAATGIESSEIQDKVVAELEAVGFINGEQLTPGAVKNDMRRWISHNQKGMKHNFWNKKTDTVEVNKKRAVVEELYSVLDAAEGDQLDMDVERIWVAQSFLLIELDAYTKNGLKEIRRKRGVGRAAIGAVAGIAAWGILSHVIVDEPPKNNDRQPVEIENQLPSNGGGIDSDNDGLNP